MITGGLEATAGAQTREETEANGKGNSSFSNLEVSSLGRSYGSFLSQNGFLIIKHVKNGG